MEGNMRQCPRFYELSRCVDFDLQGNIVQPKITNNWISKPTKHSDLSCEERTKATIYDLKTLIFGLEEKQNVVIGIQK